MSWGRHRLHRVNTERGHQQSRLGLGLENGHKGAHKRAKGKPI